MCAGGGGCIGVKPTGSGFLRPLTVSSPGVAGPLKVRVGLGAKTQIVELVLP